ncbi:MAG: hypothetical protein Q9214_002744 [Letrouitia sp. 1 TL-2023]
MALVATAESARDVAICLDKFLEYLPENSTEITALISECYAISSALRELDTAKEDPRYSRGYGDVHQDVQIVRRSLEYTFHDVHRLFGGLGRSAISNRAARPSSLLKFNDLQARTDDLVEIQDDRLGATFNNLSLGEPVKKLTIGKPALDNDHLKGEGLSIAGSLVAVAAAGYHISVNLTTLATQIDTASERISSIAGDVSLTSSALQQLSELMNYEGTVDDMSIFNQSSLETTRISATTCQNIFKELEQAVQSASEQIRGKGKLVGEKIKLSKFEKLKWPFLQPKINIFREELQNAKGTLMLMLQVASLFFSKKMAELHHSTSATLIEQRDIVHAILTLQTAQQRERDDRVDPENLSPSNTPSLTSAILTPGESEKDESEARPFLDLFLLKPMVKDVGEVVELSWHVRKQSIPQSNISAQLARDLGCSLPVSEMCESLYDHEHKAINSEVEKANTSPAVLLSLKRRYMDLRHREMVFRRVPSLRFIIRRERVSPVDTKINNMSLNCMLREREAVAGSREGRGGRVGGRVRRGRLHREEMERLYRGGYRVRGGYTPPSQMTSSRIDEHAESHRRINRHLDRGNTSHYRRQSPLSDSPSLDYAKEHTPDSTTFSDQESPEEYRPSLALDKSENAPQDEKANGTDDKSAEEADVQRIVEQLLSKYTTIFEKGLVP